MLEVTGAILVTEMLMQAAARGRHLAEPPVVRDSQSTDETLASESVGCDGSAADEESNGTNHREALSAVQDRGHNHKRSRVSKGSVSGESVNESDAEDDAQIAGRFSALPDPGERDSVLLHFDSSHRMRTTPHSEHCTL